MKNAKRILSILIACAMLMMAMPMVVSAAGTKDDPIDAATKWFGYGVNTYLLNPSIAEGSDGMWYTLTADQAGILSLEHSYKNVDYTITITVNGIDYVGGCVDGVPYNRPIMTLPLQVGDVATVAIVTKDAAAGTVYASMNVIAGDVDNTIKVKSEGIDVYVAAGQTVYFQDDSLQAVYATKGLLVEGNVADTAFYAVTKNTESGSTSEKEYTDIDADGIIEVQLGGSLGGAGAPPVKPAWAIENNSAEDRCYTLTIVGAAHECAYDDDADIDCNSCGAIREIASPSCQHVYDHDFDGFCNLCGEERAVTLPLSITGNSISADVNGLAWRIVAQVDGVELNGNEANYANATVGGYKLITMGAVVNNQQYAAKLEDVNGTSIVDIEAKNVSEIDGAISFAIRVINIPDEFKDSEIDIFTYVIFEDEAGVQHTLYCNSAYATYNQFV